MINICRKQILIHRSDILRVRLDGDHLRGLEQGCYSVVHVKGIKIRGQTSFRYIEHNNPRLKSSIILKMLHFNIISLIAHSYAVTKYRAEHGASGCSTSTRVREREIWRLPRASIDLQLSKTFESVSGVRSRQWRSASWVCKKIIIHRISSYELFDSCDIFI